MGQPMTFVFIVSFLSYNIISLNSPDWQDIERYGRAEIKQGGVAAAILDSNLNVVYKMLILVLLSTSWAVIVNTKSTIWVFPQTKCQQTVHPFL